MTSTENEKKSQRLSVIEILVILSAIGTVMALAIPPADNQRGPHDHTKVSCYNQLKEWESVLIDYYHSKGEFPSSMEPLITHAQEGNRSSSSFPQDVWGNPFQLKLTQSKEHRFPDITIYSLGPDGVPSNDDLSVTIDQKSLTNREDKL
ncbi:MAG: type II secretion system protein GspG [Planctomycetaceae bacterium]|nr:type II secretion system protein GspG [Planctomycetaceae bacterium]